MVSWKIPSLRHFVLGHFPLPCLTTQRVLFGWFVRNTQISRIMGCITIPSHGRFMMLGFPHYFAAKARFCFGNGNIPGRWPLLEREAPRHQQRAGGFNELENKLTSGCLVELSRLRGDDSTCGTFTPEHWHNSKFAFCQQQKTGYAQITCHDVP